MPYKGERPATTTELQARGLIAPGPLSPPMDPKTPTVNEESLKSKAAEDIVGRQKAQVAQGMTQILQQAGKSPEEIRSVQERILGKLPGTVTELAGMAVPWLVGGAIKPARTASRFAGQLGANMLGRAAVQGASEFAKPPEDRNVMGGIISGAAKGVLPGLAQGTASMIGGPSKATLQTQKAIQAIKKEASPGISALLDVTKPG